MAEKKKVKKIFSCQNCNTIFGETMPPVCPVCNSFTKTIRRSCRFNHLQTDIRSDSCDHGVCKTTTTTSYMKAAVKCGACGTIKQADNLAVKLGIPIMFWTPIGEKRRLYPTDEAYARDYKNLCGHNLPENHLETAPWPLLPGALKVVFDRFKCACGAKKSWEISRKAAVLAALIRAESSRKNILEGKNISDGGSIINSVVNLVKKFVK